MHASFELFSPFLKKCGHRKGKLFAWSPQDLWKRRLFVIGQSALFSRCGKDAKIPLHLWGLELELYEYFIASIHANVEWQEEGRLSG